MKLTQEKIFEKRVFTIQNNGLDVNIESPKGNQKFLIPFEEVGTRKFYKSASKVVPYIVIAIFGIILLILTYSYVFTESSMNEGTFLVNIIVWPIIILIIFLSSKQKSVFLVGSQRSIEFFADVPSEQEVENFLDKLIITTKVYLKEKYGKIDLDIPEEILIQNLLFLKNTDIITNDEYEELKKEYKLKKII